MSLEKYFAPFREQVVGRSQTFISPFGKKKIIYADWTYIMNAIEYIANYHKDLARDCKYHATTNDFRYKEDIYAQNNKARDKGWFKL